MNNKKSPTSTQWILMMKLFFPSCNHCELPRKNTIRLFHHAACLEIKRFSPSSFPLRQLSAVMQLGSGTSSSQLVPLEQGSD